MAPRCFRGFLLFGVNMLRKILVLVVLSIVGMCAYAQTGAIEGFCNRGGQSATVSGLNSTNKFQNVINSCTISIYQTGTNTLVPGNQIFSNSTGTVLGNPFTADNATSMTPGKWLFFISTTTAVDVYGSGGIAPNTYPAPVPLCIDCYASSQFTPVSGVLSAQGTAPIQVNGVSGTPETGNLTVSCLNATDSAIGCSKPDGSTITASAGTYSCATATNSQLGCSRPDGTSITVSGGVLSATPATPTLNLEHNGSSSGISQTTLNFLDVPPSLPSGYEPVIFDPDSGGGLGGYVLNTTSSFTMAQKPPVGGQNYFLQPSSCTVTYGGDNVRGIGTCSLPTPDPAGNSVQPGGSVYCPSNTGPLAPCDVTVTFDFTLPSFITQANITAVYQSSNSAVLRQYALHPWGTDVQPWHSLRRSAEW